MYDRVCSAMIQHPRSMYGKGARGTIEERTFLLQYLCLHYFCLGL